ncbi:GL22413 [Drosophila persimilis]|uniref:GL22413 n=1 Tax=Drosophila persimilis TaxID=7234 RepID=B4HA24_DROPE|nr:GL22413 [Drosophila persimilis]
MSHQQFHHYHHHDQLQQVQSESVLKGNSSSDLGCERNPQNLHNPGHSTTARGIGGGGSMDLRNLCQRLDVDRLRENSYYSISPSGSSRYVVEI